MTSLLVHFCSAPMAQDPIALDTGQLVRTFSPNNDSPVAQYLGSIDREEVTGNKGCGAG